MYSLVHCALCIVMYQTGLLPQADGTYVSKITIYLSTTVYNNYWSVHCMHDGFKLSVGHTWWFTAAHNVYM